MEQEDKLEVDAPMVFPSHIIEDEMLSYHNRRNKRDTANFLNGINKWSSYDGTLYVPASETTKKLPCGIYEIKNTNQGLGFKLLESRVEGYIRFPQTNIDKVVSEIENFWEREYLFKEYNLTYKRGVILYGPPGTGKSVLLQLIMDDVIKRNGIVIKFTHPDLFLDGLRMVRQIEPDTPIVVSMEDIDAILKSSNETLVLNILDGVEKLDKIVFLATTNYPEELGDRIINRPSRFDKRFKIGNLNFESRKIYFNSLIKNHSINIDVEQWCKDTEGFSIAHLKELFIAVVILQNDYEESLITLRKMKEKPVASKDRDTEVPVGFSNCSIK